VRAPPPGRPSKCTSARAFLRGTFVKVYSLGCLRRPTGFACLVWWLLSCRACTRRCDWLLACAAPRAASGWRGLPVTPPAGGALRQATAARPTRSRATTRSAGCAAAAASCCAATAAPPPSTWPASAWRRCRPATGSARCARTARRRRWRFFTGLLELLLAGCHPAFQVWVRRFRVNVNACCSQSCLARSLLVYPILVLLDFVMSEPRWSLLCSNRYCHQDSSWSRVARQGVSGVHASMLHVRSMRANLGR